MSSRFVGVAFRVGAVLKRSFFRTQGPSKLGPFSEEAQAAAMAVADKMRSTFPKRRG